MKVLCEVMKWAGVLLLGAGFCVCDFDGVAGLLIWLGLLAGGAACLGCCWFLENRRPRRKNKRRV